MYLTALIYPVPKNNAQLAAEPTETKMNIHCPLGDVTLDTWQITAVRRINNLGDRKCHESAFIFQPISASLCLAGNKNWCSYLLSYTQRGGQPESVFIPTGGCMAYPSTRKA